jgi:SpoVK/Ycf46/Vps4 family AAA+-type ATPase
MEASQAAPSAPIVSTAMPKNPPRRATRSTQSQKSRIFHLALSTAFKDQLTNVVWIHPDDARTFFKKGAKRFIEVANEVFEVAVSSNVLRGTVFVNHNQYEEFAKAIFGHQTITLTTINPTLCRLIQRVHFVISRSSLMSSGTSETTYARLESLNLDFKNHLKDRFVSLNQQFDVPVNDALIFHAQVVDLTFESGADPKLASTPYGKLDARTIFNFAVAENQDVVIIHPSFEDEQANYRFALEIQQFDAKTQPLCPIPLSGRDLDFLVAEKISGKTLSRGFSFLVELEGWTIKATLVSVKFKQDFKVPDLSGSKYTPGYVVSYFPMVEFIEKKDLFVLVKDTPKASRELIFEVQSFTPFKGHSEAGLSHGWINVEEVSVLLKKMDVSFMTNQTVRLTTSNGVVELLLTEAKPADLLLPEGGDKPHRQRWLTREDTLISLKTPESAEYAVIQSPKAQPINKITFFMDSVGEAPVLVEDELRTLIKSLAPKKVVRHQVIEGKLPDGQVVYFKVHTMGRISNKEGDIADFIGELAEETEFNFTTDEKVITILKSGQIKKLKQMIDPVDRLAEVGLTGLPSKFEDVLRTLVWSRGELSELLEERKQKQIKGVLLYGPPGTGKSSVGRLLRLVMDDVKVHAVSATDMLKKYIGESEQEFDKLLAEARSDYAKLGKKSPLHVVMLDEVDTILRNRSQSTSFQADLTNHVLTRMQGVNDLPNVVFFGMTNRIKDLDPAALRDGRFDEKIEFGSPNDEQRKKIIDLYLKPLREQNALDKSVTTESLLALTKEFTGADIMGLVRKAGSYSALRLSVLWYKMGREGQIKEETRKQQLEDLKKHPQGLITISDFKEAYNQREKPKELTYFM